MVQIGTHDEQPGQEGLPAEETGGTPPSAPSSQSSGDGAPANVAKPDQERGAAGAEAPVFATELDSALPQPPSAPAPGVGAGPSDIAGIAHDAARPDGLASWPTGLGGRGRLVPVIGVAAAVIALFAGGGAYLSVQKSSPARAADADKSAKSRQPAAAPPEHVLSITPADGTKGVNGAADIRVDFSSPLSATSPMPTLKPSIDGSWQRQGTTAVFVPARGYKARTKVTVSVPAGGAGVRSAAGGMLAARVTDTFRTGRYSQARLEQLLAELGYLPLTWAPSIGSAPPLTDAHAQLSAAYDPPAGTYTWQPGYPEQLMRLWRPNKPSLILRGAVMAFEADHGLGLDGVAGRQVWRALFRAVAADQANGHGYTYAVAREKLPETLTVWHNGRVIFHHLANTGIPAAPTAVGTDPVYLRYRHQIMRGRNPDGSKYADPVAWVAYFHYGEAVHYFPRYSYGSPQSLGCVELPYGPAKWIWPYLTFGTLVTVTGA